MRATPFHHLIDLSSFVAFDSGEARRRTKKTYICVVVLAGFGRCRNACIAIA